MQQKTLLVVSQPFLNVRKRAEGGFGGSVPPSLAVALVALSGHGLAAQAPVEEANAPIPKVATTAVPATRLFFLSAPGVQQQSPEEVLKPKAAGQVFVSGTIKAVSPDSLVLQTTRWEDHRGKGGRIDREKVISLARLQKGQSGDKISEIKPNLKAEILGETAPDGTFQAIAAKFETTIAPVAIPLNSSSAVPTGTETTSAPLSALPAAGATPNSSAPSIKYPSGRLSETTALVNGQSVRLYEPPVAPDGQAYPAILTATMTRPDQIQRDPTMDYSGVRQMFAYFDVQQLVRNQSRNKVTGLAVPLQDGQIFVSAVIWDMVNNRVVEGLPLRNPHGTLHGLYVPGTAQELASKHPVLGVRVRYIVVQGNLDRRERAVSQANTPKTGQPDVPAAAPEPASKLPPEPMIPLETRWKIDPSLNSPFYEPNLKPRLLQAGLIPIEPEWKNASQEALAKETIRRFLHFFGLKDVPHDRPLVTDVEERVTDCLRGAEMLSACLAYVGIQTRLVSMVNSPGTRFPNIIHAGLQYRTKQFSGWVTVDHTLRSWKDPSSLLENTFKRTPYITLARGGELLLLDGRTAQNWQMTNPVLCVLENSNGGKLYVRQPESNIIRVGEPLDTILK